MANGIWLGWEATCDDVSMRLPGSQETWEECSAALPIVRQVMGSRLGALFSEKILNPSLRFRMGVYVKNLSCVTLLSKQKIIELIFL